MKTKLIFRRGTWTDGHDSYPSIESYVSSARRAMQLNKIAELNGGQLYGGTFSGLLQVESERFWRGDGWRPQ